MEAEDVVNLFDSFWFYPKVLKKHLNSPAPEPPLADQNQENSGRQRVPTKLSIHSRSRSHDHIIIKRDTSFKPDSSSPNSVFLKPHLETILSQKEISQEIPRTHANPQMKKPIEGFKKARKGSSKSLSELEFEELKGFMDLGFVFSEEDKNSSLADIIPGLQRFGPKNDCEVQEETTCGGGGGVEEIGGSRARPYLSEAWGILEKESRENPLTHWRVPVVSNEIEMKDGLKWWAHAVASAVR